LTYHAARAVLQRANTVLGTNWTLHDLRHTAAQRMLADPAFTLVDVQTILRHASVTTTQIYTQPRLEDLIGKVLEHYARPPAPARPSSTASSSSDPTNTHNPKPPKDLHPQVLTIAPPDRYPTLKASRQSAK
jgi:hypothetical protein